MNNGPTRFSIPNHHNNSPSNNKPLFYSKNSFKALGSSLYAEREQNISMIRPTYAHVVANICSNRDSNDSTKYSNSNSYFTPKKRQTVCILSNNSNAYGRHKEQRKNPNNISLSPECPVSSLSKGHARLILKNTSIASMDKKLRKESFSANAESSGTYSNPGINSACRESWARTASEGTPSLLSAKLQILQSRQCLS